VQPTHSSSFILKDHKFPLICNIYSDTIIERLPHYEGPGTPQAPSIVKQPTQPIILCTVLRVLVLIESFPHLKYAGQKPNSDCNTLNKVVLSLHNKEPGMIMVMMMMITTRGGRGVGGRRRRRRRRRSSSSCCF
jgi:hypothetical protein